jgi:spermidine synthase
VIKTRKQLWNPYIIVFLSSSCIMIIELVASRLVAPEIGVSLYTWTSVIGVILAGMSLGNYIGGRLADQRASPRFLGLILLFCSLGSLSILGMTAWLGGSGIPIGFPVIAWVVLYIAAIFFLPSLLLGCISPIVVTLSLTDLKRTGATVGKIYAWSTAGSIAGTFATGFFLISWFGTRTVILMVSGLLLIMAIWFLTDTTRRAAIVGAGAALALFAGAIGLLSAQQALASNCLYESNYFCINVEDYQDGNGEVRKLLLDRLVHSYSNLNDPTDLVYGYEQSYAAAVEPMVERKPNLDALFIGGGGYTFPRYLEAILPASNLTVAEIDPAVTEVAHEMLGLRRDTAIQTYNVDARIFLQENGKANSYDLVFGDAFNDYSVPYHLTTIEFDQMVKNVLRDDGMYIANLVDYGQEGHFLRAYVRTVQKVFSNVAVLPYQEAWRESIRNTFVVLASDAPLPLEHLAGQTLVLSTEELEEYLSMEEPLILRDDYVPVDNLLAPVFRAEAQRE